MRFVGLFALLIALPAQAAADCRAIKDDVARLACFDAAAAPAATAQPDDTILNRLRRPDYARQVERALLGAGLDVAVRGLEHRAPSEAADAFKEFPRLHVFGHMSNPLIYQLLTQAPILEQARGAGFRAVEFQDRLGAGRWFFVLPATGALPQCDQAKRLCL